MSGFKDVVGHTDIIKYIQNAVSQNKISHAYILNGQRGAGKKLLASLFAMTLQCESGQSEPCMECRSCMQTKGGNQPDIITIKHEKPASISVDDIREHKADVKSNSLLDGEYFKESVDLTNTKPIFVILEGGSDLISKLMISVDNS